MDVLELRMKKAKIDKTIDEFLQSRVESTSRGDVIDCGGVEETNSTEVLSSIYELIQLDAQAKHSLTRQDLDVYSFEFWK